MTDTTADILFDGPMFVFRDEGLALLAEWEVAPPSRNRDLHLDHIRGLLAEIEAAEGK